MTLENVISFVERNEGRSFPTIGGRTTFSVKRKGQTKALVFLTSKKANHNMSFDWIDKCLSIFNANGSYKTTSLRSTNTFSASYILGLFRQIREEEEFLAITKPSLPEDLDRMVSDKDLHQTTKQALIAARVGQGKFRDDVLKLWNNRCCVTDSVTERAIRASHIKPWRDSTNQERLDPANGLPLVASLDALFDAGLISFEDSGVMCISKDLSLSERQIYGVVNGSLRKAPSPKTAEFLRLHRMHRFKV